MTRNQIVIEEMVSQQALASLAATNGNCITATVGIPVPAQIRPRINHTIREVEKQLKASEIEVRIAKMLLERLHELESTIETEGDWAVALAIYCSMDTFRCFHVPELTKDVITYGEKFQIRPLLDTASREQRFYILALSQKKVRIFECGMYRLDEVDLKGRVPQNLHVFLSMKMPDHVLDNRASGVRGVGSMKGVVFGTNSDREKFDEYLAHFFRAIDTGLHAVLASESAPLILAGVEEELALYRKINTYKNLTERDIHGSPDGVSPRELFQRSREIMRQRLSAPVAKVVREFEEHRNAKRVSWDLAEILAQAAEGRVSDLLIRQDAERRGAYDNVAQKIHETDEEDLLNLAAILTLTHGGQAFSLRASEMPEAAEVAAVLRY